jgi:hypothetical protein
MVLSRCRSNSERLIFAAERRASHFVPNSSGSFAMFAAMRRASSRDISFAAERRPGSSS